MACQLHGVIYCTSIQYFQYSSLSLHYISMLTPQLIVDLNLKLVFNSHIATEQYGDTEKPLHYGQHLEWVLLDCSGMFRALDSLAKRTRVLSNRYAPLIAKRKVLANFAGRIGQHSFTLSAFWCITDQAYSAKLNRVTT